MFNQFNVVSEFNRFGPQSCRRLTELLALQTEDYSQFMALVYGPPKTGNSTLAASLGLAPGCISVLSSHFLSSRAIRSYITDLATYHPAEWEDIKTMVRDTCALQSFLKAAGFFSGYEMLRPEALKGTKIPLVCGVRDPVSLMFSWIFYHYRRATEQEIRDVVARVRDQEMDHWLGIQDRWFRDDFVQVTGWNPLETGFSPAEGFMVHETESFRILLIRTDVIERRGSLALASLLKRGSVGIETRNRAEDRQNFQLYREMRNSFQIDKTLFDKIAGLEVSRTFFLPEEIARWGSAEI